MKKAKRTTVVLLGAAHVAFTGIWNLFALAFLIPEYGPNSYEWSEYKAALPLGIVMIALWFVTSLAILFKFRKEARYKRAALIVFMVEAVATVLVAMNFLWKFMT